MGVRTGNAEMPVSSRRQEQRTTPKQSRKRLGMGGLEEHLVLKRGGLPVKEGREKIERSKQAREREHQGEEPEGWRGRQRGACLPEMRAEQQRRLLSEMKWRCDWW